jgi:GDP-4-dehydro-6-deoxy-D-mannose reductase
VRKAVAEIKPDRVIHLAAQSFVPASFDAPRDTYDSNFLGTFNLLAALKQAGFTGRVLFAGSGDAYGLVAEERLPIVEDQPLKPRSPYSVSKVAAEALCYQWSQTEAFELVMTRSFNHIGPGQSERFAISNFAKQIIEIQTGRREAVLSVGDIDVSRDFTDVRDVARAYALLLDHGRNGEVYNVCSGVERSIRSLLVRLLELAQVEARIEQDPARLRKAEQRRIYGSYQKLRTDTGWEPQTGIDQSLTDILKTWKDKLS